MSTGEGKTWRKMGRAGTEIGAGRVTEDKRREAPRVYRSAIPPLARSEFIARVIRLAQPPRTARLGRRAGGHLVRLFGPYPRLPLAAGWSTDGADATAEKDEARERTCGGGWLIFLGQRIMKPPRWRREREKSADSQRPRPIPGLRGEHPRSGGEPTGDSTSRRSLREGAACMEPAYPA
ncbi:hypothetical protein KM043_018024 [Ampulex compressa]|nr:hypothetical protein KM043_018024 [Ampulex compressa]